MAIELLARILREAQDHLAWRLATGIEHSPTSATGGWEPTPWHATQRAAWEALDSTSRQ